METNLSVNRQIFMNTWADTPLKNKISRHEYKWCNEKESADE